VSAPILQLQSLCIDLVATPSPQRLVHDVTFAVGRGEIVGLVGESGSGKTLSAFAVAGLLSERLAISGGEILFEGRARSTMDDEAMRAVRGGRIGFVFQDPLSSFNPVRTVGSMLVESVRRHQRLDRRAAREVAIAALAEMRLPGRDACFGAYPHQLSGGQRQRAMLALASVNAPSLLIADEPTTALDPTIQLQILALLRRQSETRGCILITHDLAVAGAVCDRIAVMQKGRVVEFGACRSVLDNPQHDYTRRLLQARGQR
jgi:ABC-type glutathione transport system ATPase component